MKKTLNLSLSAKIALWLAMTGLLIIIITSVFEFTNGTRKTKSEIRSKVNTITKRIQSSIKFSVYEFDYQSIKEILLSEFESEDIASIHVWSYPDREILCGLGIKKGKITDIPKPIKGSHIISKEEFITIKHNSNNPTPEKIGILHISYDKNPPTNRLTKLIINSIVKSSIVIIIICVILYYITSKLLVSPLEKIIATITEIEKEALDKNEVNNWNPEKSLTSLNNIKFYFPELTSLSHSLSAMITTIKEGQINIGKSEENLRITLNSIGDAVIATDAESNITQMNPVAEKLTGWILDDAKEQKLEEVFKIINTFTRETVESPIKKVLESGEIVGLANHTILISKDKSEMHIADSGAPIRDRKGNITGVVLVFRDITEQYKLEEQIRQSQKMESIGQLAGGVAHDFNNMLAGIIGAADELNDLLENEEEKQVYTNLILKAAIRAADLTKQLLAFSRKGAINESIFSVILPIKDTLSLLKRSIDPKVKISAYFENHDLLIKGDMAQFQNAIMNLCINARDAMDDGGTITIKTEIELIEHSILSHTGIEIIPDKYIKISITDTGTGISNETARHMFEPFYTTKSVGEGTGLGLAAVYGTIKDFSGYIDFKTEIGKGTTFFLYIPLADQSEVISSQNEPTLPKGEGTILIIDDEGIIRNMAKNILNSIGYNALLAINGQDGINIYEKEKDNIDLVLLDMLMPVMNGKETFKHLKQINPEVKVLISSGYSSDKEVTAILEQGASGFLHKPYKKSELAKEIFKILNV